VPGKTLLPSLVFENKTGAYLSGAALR